jgi:hypothetical protein
MFENIYLTGGAYGMIYQLGALTQLRSEIESNNSNLYGCSAGALIIVMARLYSDKELLDLYKKILADGLNTALLDLNLTVHHMKIFDKLNRDHPDAYLKLDKSINIGVATQTGFRWYNTFTSNKELFHILLCSFHVPFLCSYNAEIDNVNCIDGGLGINVEVDLPDNCFVICPKIYLKKNTNHSYINGEIPILICVFPPLPPIADYYYNKGINDMIEYKASNKSHSIKLYAIDEEHIPPTVWFFLRSLQPRDTKNVLSNIK